VSQIMKEDDIAPLAGPAFAGAFEESMAFARGNAMRDNLQVDSDTLAKMLINSYEMTTLMADYASRYGFLLGGLEMVAKGLATADAVLESYKAKYETTPEPEAERPTP